MPKRWRPNDVCGVAFSLSAGRAVAVAVVADAEDDAATQWLGEGVVAADVAESAGCLGGGEAAGSWDRGGLPATARGALSGQGLAAWAGCRSSQRMYVHDGRIHCSQSRWPAASAYPTNATASISACAMISGHSLPVRSHT